MIIIAAATAHLCRLGREYLRSPEKAYFITPNDVFEKVRGVRGPVFFVDAWPPGFNDKQWFKLKTILHQREASGDIRIITIHERDI